MKIRISDIVCDREIRTRATVVQQKTGRPVQFELMDDARTSLLKWLELRGGSLDEFTFPSRTDHAKHISTRQYARLVDEWVTGIGLPSEDYETHSLRRTKASIIYKATGVHGGDLASARVDDRSGLILLRPGSTAAGGLLKAVATLLIAFSRSMLAMPPLSSAIPLAARRACLLHHSHELVEQAGAALREFGVEALRPVALNIARLREWSDDRD